MMVGRESASGCAATARITGNITDVTGIIANESAGAEKSKSGVTSRPADESESEREKAKSGMIVFFATNRRPNFSTLRQESLEFGNDNLFFS